MNVLTVSQAAAFLQVHEDTIYRLLEKREIPAGKVRGSWRLIKEDLADWLRSQYSTKAREPSLEEESCRTNVKEQVSGGSSSEAYDSLLGLKTRKLPQRSKTS